MPVQAADEAEEEDGRRPGSARRDGSAAGRAAEEESAGRPGGCRYQQGPRRPGRPGRNRRGAGTGTPRRSGVMSGRLRWSASSSASSPWSGWPRRAGRRHARVPAQEVGESPTGRPPCSGCGPAVRRRRVGRPQATVLSARAHTTPRSSPSFTLPAAPGPALPRCGWTRTTAAPAGWIATSTRSSRRPAWPRNSSTRTGPPGRPTAHGGVRGQRGGRAAHRFGPRERVTPAGLRLAPPSHSPCRITARSPNPRRRPRGPRPGPGAGHPCGRPVRARVPGWCWPRRPPR